MEGIVSVIAAILVAAKLLQKRKGIWLALENRQKSAIMAIYAGAILTATLIIFLFGNWVRSLFTGETLSSLVFLAVILLTLAGVIPAASKLHDHVLDKNRK
ncbi:hypothetical protein [Salisediminibacterium selenitireducens]|uniref:Uncharacterized protein n=1 Tax=Bacillus selenitireducens (strain ATCC 700615 / DSM 15326 / MLS10) TaxID=439292 RepID=D6XXS3_BACIE|nr:hypothetical protein [Salisediminibacterium selenitireducens]ADI00116.1 hypothetical protein Bsel_2616 [[Bacillus] selenitireducens MLS10]